MKLKTRFRKKILLLILLLFVKSANSFSQAIPPGREHSSQAEFSASHNLTYILFNFLKWYVANKERLTSYSYPINGSPGDSTQRYSLNRANLIKYIKEIKKSGFVSDVFLLNLQDFYFNVGLQLNNQPPQYDGPIDGLETDHFLQTFEEDFIDSFKSFKPYKEIKNRDHILQYILLNNHIKCNVYLSRHHHKWLIDHYTFNRE
jgi:VanZ family protein